VVLVLGSQNSSNSQRLAELAAESGVRAYLIDGPADIDFAWFRFEDTVLVTAGASAPETVVEQCVQVLDEHFGATVESRAIREEEVYFPLPKEFRQIAASQA
jgi:4-hydroxy-3-methylbut-2-enyl diphosphate reductase